jgi:hypothetical protein
MRCAGALAHRPRSHRADVLSTGREARGFACESLVVLRTFLNSARVIVRVRNNRCRRHAGHESTGQSTDRREALQPSEVVGTGVDPVTSRFSGARSTN